SAQYRDDDEWECTREQTVEDIARVVVEHEEAREGHDSRSDGSADGALLEILHHLVVGESTSVPDEVYRGEVRAHRDREDPPEERGGVDPAAPDIAARSTGWDAAGRDRARDTAHEERNEERRHRERSSEVSLTRGARDFFAEREARAAQHDAECRERQRDEQRERDRLECFGEPGPQDDEDKDQPDVVRFPDRADGVVHDGAGLGAAFGVAGEEVPEPGAEVGAAEERVSRDAEHEDDRDDIVHQTGTVSRSDSPSVGIGRGSYGPPTSVTPCRARKRRLIIRNTRIKVVPSPM